MTDRSASCRPCSPSCSSWRSSLLLLQAHRRDAGPEVLCRRGAPRLPRGQLVLAGLVPGVAAARRRAAVAVARRVRSWPRWPRPTRCRRRGARCSRSPRWRWWWCSWSDAAAPHPVDHGGPVDEQQQHRERPGPVVEPEEQVGRQRAGRPRPAAYHGWRRRHTSARRERHLDREHEHAPSPLYDDAWSATQVATVSHRPLAGEPHSST